MTEQKDNVVEDGVEETARLLVLLLVAPRLLRLMVPVPLEFAVLLLRRMLQRPPLLRLRFLLVGAVQGRVQ